MKTSQNTIFLTSFHPLFDEKTLKKFRLRRAVEVFSGGIEDFLSSQFEARSFADHVLKYLRPYCQNHKISKAINRGLFDIWSDVSHLPT